MSAKKIRSFPDAKDGAYLNSPKPVTPRCQHKVQVMGWHDERWRTGRYADRPGDWDQCTFPSVVIVNGRHYCRRHGGQVVLDLYLEGKIVDV